MTSLTGPPKYESTSKKFFAHRDTTVLSYLARAYYEAGRLAEAKSTLMRALHLKPTNQATQYNLALTHMQAAHLAFKKPSATSPEIRTATVDLAHAVKCVLCVMAHYTMRTHYTQADTQPWTQTRS